MVPAAADAESQAPAAQQIDFRRLLGDEPGLPLWCDEYPARQADFLRHRRKEAQRHEGFVERISFVISRSPAIPCRGAEHMIGHLDVRVAEILRGLRPVANPRRIAADIA